MHFNIASDDFSFTRLKQMTQYFLLPSILLTGCTTTQEIKRPDGAREYLIACGASLSWSVCYSEANKTCPGGYETISEDAGFNRKELRIACPKTNMAKE